MDNNKIRPIRISDKVWEQLKSIKKRGQSWDLFLKSLINKYKDKQDE